MQSLLAMRGFKTDCRKIQFSRSYSYFSGVWLLSRWNADPQTECEKQLVQGGEKEKPPPLNKLDQLPLQTKFADLSSATLVSLSEAFSYNIN